MSYRRSETRDALKVNVMALAGVGERDKSLAYS